MAQRKVIRSLLIDADDTLWEATIYYLECNARFRELMRTLGVEPTAAQAALDQTERELIPSLGYGPASYITALGVTAARLMEGSQESLVQKVVGKARACGHKVLDPPMVLLSNVEDTLSVLRPRSLLVMVTKGETAHQLHRLGQSGLGRLFDHERVVSEKGSDTYSEIVTDLDLDPATTWMVGNSIKSDINPALEAGIGAIHIPHVHTWSAEQAELRWPERTITLERFGQLATYFEA